MVTMKRIKVLGAFLPSPLLKYIKSRSWQLPGFVFRATQPGPWWSCGSAWLWWCPQHIRDLILSVSDKLSPLNAARSLCPCTRCRESLRAAPASPARCSGATARLKSWHPAHSLPIPCVPEQATARAGDAQKKTFLRGNSSYPSSSHVCPFSDFPSERRFQGLGSVWTGTVWWHPRAPQTLQQG